MKNRYFFYLGPVMALLLLVFFFTRKNEKTSETKNNFVSLVTQSPQKDSASISSKKQIPNVNLTDSIIKQDSSSNLDVIYKRVTKWQDSSIMVDSKVDGVIYIKKDNSYYKRQFSGPIHVKWFGAKGDGITDDTYAIQKLLDLKFKEILFDKGTYLVKKNKSLSGFPNNDQPCLLIRDRINMKIHGNNATIKVKEHAQGILELQKCTNIIINDLNVIGSGNFPKLDGLTGRGEKGIINEGYYTAGFWGNFKNNSKNTSSQTGGGFNKKFPQFQGSQNNSKWGTWGNGYIGNVSYGILIHNACENITLTNCTAKLFNYVGIGVGHNGDYYPNILNYKYSKNIVFKNCRADGNYEAGFHSMAVTGFKLLGSISSNSGHPQSAPTDKACDPGYGYASRGSKYYTVNGIVQNSTFRDNKRKGIDAHAGENISFIGNKVYNSPVCGIYGASTNSIQRLIGFVVSNNLVENCGYGSGSLGAIYVGASASSPMELRDISATVSNNIIKNYSGSGIRVRYANNVKVLGNMLFDSSKGNTPNLSSILIVGRNESELSNNTIVKDNKINDQSSNMLRGIQLSNCNISNIENNEINFGKDVNVAVYTTKSQNIKISNNRINLKGIGQAIISKATGSMEKNMINGKLDNKQQ